MNHARYHHRVAVAQRVVMAVVVSLLTVAGSLAFSEPANADWVRNDQWQLKALDVGTAWRLSTGAGVTVAVLDSGVDASHPDLAGQVLAGADFVDGSTDGRVDPVGHGTTVAGLIAGRDDDSAGVVGVAPNARILPVRVLDHRNRYDDAGDVAKAVRWAVDHGARVMNLSLGGTARSGELAEALRYAAAHDVVVIACTGNVTTAAESTTGVWYPAREPGVIAVAGLARSTGSRTSGEPANRTQSRGGVGGSSQAALWSGSLTGPETVLAAPAVNLLGARPGGYWRVQGTSFAAPLVTAAATLIRARYPDLSAANVINRLISTARDLGPAGRDAHYGFGEVDPVAALRSEIPEVTGNPLAGPAPVAAPVVAKPGATPNTTGGPTGSPTDPLPDAVPPAETAVVAAPQPRPDRLRWGAFAGGSTFLLLLIVGLAALRRRGPQGLGKVVVDVCR